MSIPTLNFLIRNALMGFSQTFQQKCYFRKTSCRRIDTLFCILPDYLVLEEFNCEMAQEITALQELLCTTFLLTKKIENTQCHAWINFVRLVLVKTQTLPPTNSNQFLQRTVTMTAIMETYNQQHLQALSKRKYVYWEAQ